MQACRIFVAVALSVGTGTAFLFYFGADMDDTLCKQIRSATGGGKRGIRFPGHVLALNCSAGGDQYRVT